MSILAYIPFVEPLNALQDWWYLLLVPLAFGISVIYKATRLATLEQFWHQVVVMTAQIIVAMIGLAICLAIFVQLVIRLLPVDGS
jgi:hypothetical protein